jgi:DNA-binding LacI/PurR family transcriptional regulator
MVVAMQIQRPTLETVAAHAGVSRATVSRVVNGSISVRAEIRARVENSIRELGYVPDGSARTLVTKRGGAVAIVICERDSRAFDDPWFGEVVGAARAELAEAGLQPVVMVAFDGAEQERCAEYLIGGRLDGALLLSLHDQQPLPRLLARVGLPTVALGRPPDSSIELPYVDIDNSRGAVEAMSWLRRRGRSRIAAIAGPQDMPAARDRLDGYRAVLGSEFRHSLVESGDYSQRRAKQAMAALLHREPDLDAVFVSSDTMARGAIEMIRRTGRRIPDDVAVVGFDDIEHVSADDDPALTTVRQPIAEEGRALVRCLLAQRHEHSEPVIFPTHLVVRESA